MRRARILLGGTRRRFSATGRSVFDVTVKPLLSERIPVTILTGFLGAGKTTLLNRILKGNHGKRLAVIQNEFGEVPVDDELTAVNVENPNLLVMNNGCLCCTVRGDLAPVMEDLWLQQERDGRLDGIVVETTGLAMPGPVVETFLNDAPAWISRVDAVVSVFDAKHGPAHLRKARESGEANEVVSQVAFADVLLLNKTDLVAGEELNEVEEELRSINPDAKFIRCQGSDIDLDDVLNVNAFDLDRIAEKLVEEKANIHHGHSHGHGHEHSHGHLHGLSSVSFSHEGLMDYAALNCFIGTLLAENGDSIYRCKGIVATCTTSNQTPEKVVFQGVHGHFQGEVIGEYELEKLENRMVFIGKNLDREILEKGFNECKV